MAAGHWWWLAINGSSCAASSIAFSEGGFEVVPIPQLLVGFSTQEEQLKSCDLLLNTPLDQVHEFMADLPQREANGEVCCIHSRNPDKPTHTTVWTPTT